MSTLTKVFTVLLVVFSIFFSAIVIQFSARTDKWRDVANEWKAKADGEAVKVKHLQTQIHVVLAQQQEKLTALQKEKIDAVAKLQTKTTEYADLQLRYNDLDTQMKTQQGVVANLTSQVDTQASELKRYTERNEVLQTAISDLTRINLDLNQRVKELSTNADTLDTQNKLLTQQNADMQQKIGELQQKLEVQGRSTQPVSFESPTAGDQVTARQGVRAAPIKGQITEVRGNVASISVGSAAGVIPGKTFTVYRVDGSKGGEYLGSLVIEEARPTESVGLLSDVQGRISVNDRVADRLE